MKQALSVLAILAIGTCGEPGDAVRWEGRVQDSAGVRIVTSPASDAVHASLAETPAWSIGGGADGSAELLFSRVQTAVRDAEGNLIVVDGASSQIRVFDDDGGHSWSSGREGEGPGEFDWLVGAWPLEGGGIVAQDRGLRRLTQFGPSGSLRGTARLAMDDELLGRLRPSGPAGARSVLGLVEVAALGSRTGSVVRNPVFVVRHRLDGALLDTVARLPGPSWVMGRGEGTQLRIPFSPQPSAAGSADAVAISEGERYEVRLHGADGALRRIARVADAPPARTDAHVEAYVKRVTAGAPPEAASGMLASYLDGDFPLPDALPTYSRLLFSDTGELWAQRYEAPEASSVRWDVFDPEGHHFGGVDVPASFRITEIGGGQALGVATDEMGVERIQAFELSLE